MATILAASTEQGVYRTCDPAAIPLRLVPLREGLSAIDIERYPYTYLPEYIAYVSKGGPAMLAISEDGSIACPVRFGKAQFLKFGQLLSPPLCHGEALPPEREAAFISSLLQHLRDDRLCDRLLQPVIVDLFQSFPAESRHCAFGSYILPLQQKSEDELLQGMHHDHRRKIRGAVRQGAEVRFGRDQLPAFAKLHARAFEGSAIRSGNEVYFQDLYDRLAQSDHVLCAVVCFGGTPMGGAFVPFTRHAGYYLSGGSAAEVEPSGAIKLLHWEIIRRLRTLGVEKYDFLGARLSDVQGTKLEFIQRFKSRFGCELQQGYLWKMDLRPAACQGWDVMHWVNARLKGRPLALPDIIDQEQAKARPAASDLIEP